MRLTIRLYAELAGTKLGVDPTPAIELITKNSHGRNTFDARARHVRNLALYCTVMTLGAAALAAAAIGLSRQRLTQILNEVEELREKDKALDAVLDELIQAEE